MEFIQEKGGYVTQKELEGVLSGKTKVTYAKRRREAARALVGGGSKPASGSCDRATGGSGPGDLEDGNGRGLGMNHTMSGKISNLSGTKDNNGTPTKNDSAENSGSSSDNLNPAQIVLAEISGGQSGKISGASPSSHLGSGGSGLLNAGTSGKIARTNSLGKDETGAHGTNSISASSPPNRVESMLLEHKQRSAVLGFSAGEQAVGLGKNEIAVIPICRTGNVDDKISVELYTESLTAKVGVDYADVVGEITAENFADDGGIPTGNSPLPRGKKGGRQVGDGLIPTNFGGHSGVNQLGDDAGQDVKGNTKATTLIFEPKEIIKYAKIPLTGNQKNATCFFVHLSNPQRIIREGLLAPAVEEVEGGRNLQRISWELLRCLMS